MNFHVSFIFARTTDREQDPRYHRCFESYEAYIRTSGPSSVNIEYSSIRCLENFILGYKFFRPEQNWEKEAKIHFSTVYNVPRDEASFIKVRGFDVVLL